MYSNLVLFHSHLENTAGKSEDERRKKTPVAVYLWCVHQCRYVHTWSACNTLQHAATRCNTLKHAWNECISTVVMLQCSEYRALLQEYSLRFRKYASVHEI